MHTHVSISEKNVFTNVNSKNTIHVPLRTESSIAIAQCVFLDVQQGPNWTDSFFFNARKKL